MIEKIRKIKEENEIYKNSLDCSFIDENDLMIRSESSKSLGFRFAKSKNKKENLKNCYQILSKIFFDEEDQSLKEVFKEKIKEATNGSGQEIDKINALHSSSLCSLLFFFSVKQKNIKIGDYTFDDVYFEYQNEALDPNHPSNMDVVLISHNNKAILFLECKFSEYIKNQCQPISKGYFEDEYSKKLYDSIKDLYTKCDCENNIVRIRFHDAYSQGIKQIISHLVGLNNFVHNIKHSSENRALPTYKTIIFQEVLFELSGYENELTQYKDLSKKVLNRFVDNGLIDKRITIEEATTYQELFKNNKNLLTDKIKQFYKFK